MNMSDWPHKDISMNTWDLCLTTLAVRHLNPLSFVCLTVRKLDLVRTITGDTRLWNILSQLLICPITSPPISPVMYIFGAWTWSWLRYIYVLNHKMFNFQIQFGKDGVLQQKVYLVFHLLMTYIFVYMYTHGRIRHHSIFCRSWKQAQRDSCVL